MNSISSANSAASRPQKILLLSVSAGAGHQRAAQALQASAAEHYPDWQVLHLDVMNYVTSGFRKIYTDFYLQLVNKAPTLWGYLYQVSNEARPTSTMERLRRAIERLNARALLDAIAEFHPDQIVCTHFLPAELLARLRKKAQLTTPVWVQVTDFDLHRMWIHQGLQGYFCANEEIAYRLQQQNLLATQIHATGIPVMPAFAKTWSRQQCAAQWQIDANKPTILLMGGGAGLGGLEIVAESILRLPGDTQLLVMAGKNQATLAALQSLQARYPERLRPFGFTNQVEQIMACADLIITKPGGLTTSECLAMGLPMIVNSPIPGQEERNADYLLEQGVALKAYDEMSLLYRLRQLLAQPQRLQTLRARAQAIGKPGAAQQVLKVLADYANQHN